jgi:hypothetical protein
VQGEGTSSRSTERWWPMRSSASTASLLTTTARHLAHHRTLCHHPPHGSGPLAPRPPALAPFLHSGRAIVPRASCREHPHRHQPRQCRDAPLVEKLGFTRCGICHYERDGHPTPRIAFEKPIAQTKSQA